MALKRAVVEVVPLHMADWDKDFGLHPDARTWAGGNYYCNKKGPMVPFAPSPPPL